MKKDLKIFTISPLSIFTLILCSFFIYLFLASGFDTSNSFRIGYALCLVVCFFLTLKNIIIAINITNNILKFYYIHHYRIRTIKFNLDKIESCILNIGTKSISNHVGITLSLEIKPVDNKNKTVLDYDFIGDVPQNIIKKFYMLKDYIPNFSHSLNIIGAPKRKQELEKFFENNMQEPLRNKIINNFGILLTAVAMLFCCMLMYFLCW